MKINESNPVVNERKSITLTVADSSGSTVSDVTWESESPDVATVDAQSGRVTGVQYGYATITARRGSDSVSTFVVVARVKNGTGAAVPGETKTDTSGRFYISDPSGSVIYQKDGLASPASVYAGKSGSNGRLDGARLAALFSGPTAIGVDNGSTGGIYVADTLNHSIRKISGDQVTTILGTGSSGGMTADTTPFSQAVFNSPRGVAVDTGGNLYVADTNNHAIYYVDFAAQTVRLLAGEPGQSGKKDGSGHTVRFTRPAGLSLSSDGKLLVIADEGNNRVRLMTQAGEVSTLGKISSRGGSALFEGRRKLPADHASIDYWKDDQAADEIAFNEPQSVGIDSTGNIYVVDKSNAKVVTRPNDRPSEVVSIAQDLVSFNQAASVTIRGNDSIVLDKGAATADDAIKVISIGPPQISTITETAARLAPNVPLEGGTRITVEGKNFAPETQVFVGDGQAVNLTIESSTRLSFDVPPQKSPGRKTLSIATRGGVAQGVIEITAKRFSELSAGQITTYAGGVQYLGDGGDGSQASAGSVADLFIDGIGNIFAVDGFNHRIRRLDVNNNVINTIAGNGTGETTPDGGTALGSGLRSPSAVALDSQGNLYVAENPLIRRVDARTGILTTFAGTKDEGFAGDGGPATEAKLFKIKDLVVDREGNVYIADSANNRIRRVDAKTGVIKTVAGNGKAGFDQDNQPATQAALNAPSGVILDARGNLLITDQENHRIRRVDTVTGVISTVAGTGKKGFDGDNGPATAASLALGAPDGFRSGSLGLDRDGNIYVADTLNHRVRRIDARTGTITTVAGTGRPSYSGDGGPATAADITGPSTVAVDGLGNIVFFDTGNTRVRRIDATSGIITTIIGKTFENGDGGPAVGAGINGPVGTTFDRNGNLLICDLRNHQIRKVNSLTGAISTIAGTGSPGYNGEDVPAAQALLNQPQGVTLDRNGNIFIADAQNHRIRRIDPNSGLISTVAGTGKPGFMGDGGPANMAEFDLPAAVAFDEQGALYIADFKNDRVRRIDPMQGTLTTFAGNGSKTTSGDGSRATAAGLPMPRFLAFDRMGNLFVSSDNRIRKIDRNGIITTVAGNGMPASGPDGVAAVANPLAATGIAVAPSGELYVAEDFNKIRRIDLSGIISTVVGTGMLGYGGDNGSAVNARINSPLGIAFDPAGNLYISDHANNAVRVVKGVTKGDPVPPALVPVADQSVRPGEVVSVSVSAVDLNDVQNLTLSLSTTLTFVTLSDKGKGQGTIRIAPAGTDKQGGRVTVKVTDADALSSEVSFNVTILPNMAPMVVTIPDQTVTVGEVRIVLVNALDRDGLAGLKLALVSAPSFAALTDNGNGFGSIRLAPSAADTSTRITVRATDPGGLTAQAMFQVTVIPNTPPAIASIADQTLKVGEVKLVTVAANDAEGTSGLRLSLASAPAYATIIDNGNGSGTVRLAPETGAAGGTVTVKVTDAGGLTAQASFAVTVQPALPVPTITNVVFASPILTISGSGFGTSGATVTINGSDVSRFIKNQSPTSISLKGKAKKLNLKTGSNQITVTVGGVASNTYVLAQ